MKSHDFLIPSVLPGVEKGNVGCFVDSQMHVHICQVYLAEVDRADPGFRRQYVLNHMLQCPPEVNHLLVDMWSDGCIEATPC